MGNNSVCPTAGHGDTGSPGWKEHPSFFLGREIGVIRQPVLPSWLERLRAVRATECSHGTSVLNQGTACGWFNEELLLTASSQRLRWYQVSLFLFGQDLKIPSLLICFAENVFSVRWERQWWPKCNQDLWFQCSLCLADQLGLSELSRNCSC